MATERLTEAEQDAANLAAYERLQAERALIQAEVAAYLKGRGVRIRIDGCGCCDSPWVTINVDGTEVELDYDSKAVDGPLIDTLDSGPGG